MYIQKYIYAILLTAIIISCGKKLDLDPKDRIDTESAITNAADVEQVLVAGYAVMDNAGLYGTFLIMFPELYITDRANSQEYMGWVGSFDTPREVANHRISTNNGDVNRIWTQAYRAINIANTALESLDVVEDAEQKKALQGEALFQRGIMHFELVRLFGQQWTGGPNDQNAQPGVPIRLKASKTTEIASEETPRSTVGQVYEQVIQDLTAASQTMPEENGNRATRYTAQAFLARVYLQKGDYPKALAAANVVIGSGKYSLNNTVTEVFRTPNTAESVWEIQQNDQNNAGDSNEGLATFYANTGDGQGGNLGRADLFVAGNFHDSFQSGDKRQGLIYKGTGAKPGNLACGKYTAFGQNIPVIRISEMYLIRAECNLRLGSATGASPAADLKTVRQRAGLKEIAAPKLEDIARERTYEFFGEGLAVHDMKRLHKSTLGGIAYNDKRMVFPIPEREIKVNEQLKQNEGY
jgi:tetratricopeptide (TPR) repeat protein